MDPFDGLETYAWETGARRFERSHVFSSRGAFFKVSQNGESFTVVQLSPVYLDRALLGKTVIPVMDEVTAAVGVETDVLADRKDHPKGVQGPNQRDNCSSYCIKTVKTSDMILVLDNGRVKEFELPTSLLLNSNSLFSND